LVVFCNDFLSQLSRQELTKQIEGFGGRSQDALAAERRRLEGRGDETLPLQRVLFELEAAAPSLAAAEYARAEDATIEFMEDHFQPLLVQIVRWLETTDDVEPPKGRRAPWASSSTRSGWEVSSGDRPSFGATGGDRRDRASGLRRVAAAISRLETNRDALRGISLTLTTAALAFASKSAFAPAAGAVAVVVLTWGDLRLLYQHNVARRRSRKVEEVVQRYVAHIVEIGRPMEAPAERAVDDALRRYRYGSNLNLVSPTIRKVAREIRTGADWSVALYLLSRCSVSPS
jgi:hypothetical protein